MKLSTSLTSALLAASVLAAPHPNGGLARRRARRSAGVRTLRDTTMVAKESKNSNTKTMAATDSTSDVTYSSNWSGATLLTPPTGETYDAVSGAFTVPTPSIPSGVAATDGEYAASAWVGIDGNTYSTAILQTGIDLIVSSSGEVSYDAWYEWYPDYAYDFDIEINAGDVINASVYATTTTSGTATIENKTTGKTATITLTSTSALGGVNAEWIVEDFEQNSELVAFADFGNLTFTGCVASTGEGTSVGVDGATIMDIEDDSGNVLTDVTLVSSSSFEVGYTDAASSSGTGSSSGSGTTSAGSSTATGSSGFGNGGFPGQGGSGNGAEGGSKSSKGSKRFLPGKKLRSMLLGGSM